MIKFTTSPLTVCREVRRYNRENHVDREQKGTLWIFYAPATERYYLIRIKSKQANKYAHDGMNRGLWKQYTDFMDTVEGATYPLSQPWHCYGTKPCGI